MARLRGRAPRILVLAAIAALSLAGARSAFAPTSRSVAPAIRPVHADMPADAFAEAFARSYLEWSSGGMASRERALRSMTSASLDAGADAEIPRDVHQHVLWTAVERSDAIDGGRTVVVRAQTTRGDLYLSVRVARGSQGALHVATYPAFVGGPATDLNARDDELGDVDDARLALVARRVVTNYLARARENLAADLTGGGVVVMPSAPLRVLSVESVAWVRRPSRVAVTVRARTRDGVRLTLTYGLSVVRRAGRWLVSGMPSMSSPKEDS
jgi:hypothetical protein